MYQAFVKLAESRNTVPVGPLAFSSAEARRDFVKGPTVYWYHFAEDDDWHSWRKGGAWEASWQPGPADIVPPEPEITEEDRW